MLFAKVFLVLIPIISYLHLGNALRCNFCVGALSSDCNIGKQFSMAYQNCSNSEEFDQYCLYGVVSESEVTSDFVVRQCMVVSKGMKICEAFKEANPTSVACIPCQEDNCNDWGSGK